MFSVKSMFSFEIDSGGMIYGFSLLATSTLREREVGWHAPHALIHVCLYNGTPCCDLH